MRKYITFVIVFCFGVIVGSARPYNGLNKGVAWDRGGIEVYPQPALFLCEADYNPLTQHVTRYKIPSFLMGLIVDC